MCFTLHDRKKLSFLFLVVNYCFECIPVLYVRNLLRTGGPVKMGLTHTHTAAKSTDKSATLGNGAHRERKNAGGTHFFLFFGLA